MRHHSRGIFNIAAVNILLLVNYNTYITEQLHFSSNFELLSFIWQIASRTPYRHGNFLNIDISQGSVAICFRYGGIFNYDFLQIYY